MCSWDGKAGKCLRHLSEDYAHSPRAPPGWLSALTALTQLDVHVQVSSPLSTHQKDRAEGSRQPRRSPEELPVQPGWRSWQLLKTSFRQNEILTAPGRHLGQSAKQVCPPQQLLAGHEDCCWKVMDSC